MNRPWTTLSTTGRYVLVWLLAVTTAPAADISILYIGDTETSAHLGARQGLREANAQGEFLGITYRLVGRDTNGAAPAAVVISVNAARVRQITEEYPDLPILNTTASATALREDCRENLFHVGPSDAMLADAESQWLRQHPGSAAAARAWHPTFRKYAASQLNSRFRDQFARDMDDDAWAGWAAIKLLTDTIARAPGLAGSALSEELKTNLAFDGQKGVDMSFRETGQLRAPLLLVEEDRIVGEAPVRGVVNTSNLDSLGVPFCPK